MLVYLATLSHTSGWATYSTGGDIADIYILSSSKAGSDEDGGKD